MLSDHVCNRGCGQSIYVFKLLAAARKGVEKKFVLAADEGPSSIVDCAPPKKGLNDRSDLRLRDNSPDSLHDEDPEDDSLQYLDVADQKLKDSIIREWQTQTSTECLKREACAVCAALTPALDIQDVEVADVDLKLLRNDELPRKVWPVSYNFEAYERAILCSDGLHDLQKPAKIRICKNCVKELNKGRMPKFAMANFLYYGREALPQEVRIAFDTASIFERMLVCRVRYNSISCRFKASEYDPNEEEGPEKLMLRNYRKGVRGNVMVTPLNVAQLNDVIPPPPEVIRDTMSVLFIGSVPPTRQTIHKLSPVLVRKSRVKVMLQFLLDHNPNYGRLAGFKGYSEDNMNKLFDGGDRGKDEAVPCAVHVGFLPLNDAVESATADYTGRNLDGPRDNVSNQLLMENVGYTVGDHSPANYADMKLLALQRCLSGKPYLASKRGSAAVPDFDNPYLMSLAFPEEDPWGIGGMLHPYRRYKITPEEQVAHLLNVSGGRFQKHSEFAFFYYNVFRKQLVSKSMRYSSGGNTYKGVIDKMLSIDLDRLTILKDKCKRDALYIPIDDTEKQIMTLMSSVAMVSRHIPGSPGHKVMLRNEIRGLINYRGAPTLFVTLNPSDVDNPIVRLLTGEDIILEDLARGEDMDGWTRKILAAQNPAACASFFDLIINKFIAVVLRFGRSGRGLFG
ncbi:hypothetical protein C8J57DRAFT_1100862, partial [Mycena rebaudengoi]